MVEWTAGLLTYKGITYNIAAGGTEKKYIYWDPNYTTLFRNTDNLQDVFDCDGWVMCINDEGTAQPVYGLPVIHAGLIQTATITADKYLELRNTYVYNGDDSLDNSHPFEVPFRIVSEMTEIVSAKLSFRLMPYRAYSTAAASGGGSTPTSGPSSGGWPEATESETVDVSGDTASEQADLSTGQNTDAEDGCNSSTEDEDCGGGLHDHNIYGRSHSHGIPASLGFDGHVHSVSINNTGNHSHALGAGFENHTHQVTVPAHGHGITYGLHEESNSPTVHFHIDNGSGFGGASADYNGDQIDLDIAGSLSGTGWKAIRFDTDLRCRVASIIELKLDITA